MSKQKTAGRPASSPESFQQPDFRVLFESTQGLHLVLSPDLKIVAANDAFLRATMTQRDEILGRDIFDVFPDNPGDPHATGVRKLSDSLKRVIETRLPHTMAIQKYDIRRPIADGGEYEERYWSPVNLPVLGSDNEITYILNHVADVTELVRLKVLGNERGQRSETQEERAQQLHAEVLLLQQEISHRKRAEAELREAEERMRSIVESAVDAIITIDEQGLIESLNPAAERLFGYLAAEVTGKNVKLLMPSPYHEQHDGYLQNYLTTGQRKIIGIGREVVGRRKDGTTFPMDLAVSEVRLADRRLFTGIVRDISERKRAEEQSRFFTAEIQQRNTELLRSNEELDDFAYIASHDLKEPLRGIHNYSSFLIEDYGDKLDDAGRSKLETLKRLTERMDSLLDSLLDTSRFGRLEFAIQETNLNELLTEVLDSLRISLHERQIDVRIPKPLPTLRCDRVRVGEVLRNLITNAMKYNNKTQKWIEIGASTVSPPAEDKPRGQKANGVRPILALYVRDNGLGIREKHYGSIFRIFKRLHARDQFGGGTGVGLTIVKKIVERHGGRIWVESKYGEGTTFYFTLAGTEQQI